MDPFRIAYGRAAPALGMALARWLPLESAHRLAGVLARSFARRKQSHIIRSLRANQSVVRNLPFDHPSLDEAVLEVLLRAGEAFISLARAAPKGRRALAELCAMDEPLLEKLDELRQQGRGVFLVGPHTAGFDIILLALKEYGLSPQALSPPNPKGVYQLQNSLRRRFGLEITPISRHTLRQAVVRLTEGGLVLTGIDFPVRQGEPLRLFGRHTMLPVGHARLAIQAGATVVVAMCVPTGERGRYRAVLKAVLPTEQEADREAGANMLAQEALEALESSIQADPGSWLMFQPLWPELLEQERD